MKNGEISRREFLRMAGGAAAAAVILEEMGRLTAANAGRPQKSRIVVVSHSGVMAGGWQGDEKIITTMLEAGIKELTGKSTVRDAWASIIKPKDVVSAKYNQEGGASLRTRPLVRDWVRQSVLAVGVEPGNCVVWSKGDLEGDDRNWTDEYTLRSGMKTRLRGIFPRQTAFINLPVCKMHWGTGITVALKNHFGSIDNAGSFHDWEQNEGGAHLPPMWKSIGEINALEPIAKRTRLVICDVLRPLWEGGPGDVPRFRWDYNAIIFGTDPVAVDSLSCDILEEQRAKVAGRPWPAESGRKSVQYAASLGLGHVDKDWMDIVNVRLG